MTIMSISYSLPLLCLLLIVDWTHAASLRSLTRSPSKWSSDRRQPSPIVDMEVTTPELVLLRRRPILISSERQRRWSNDDEVEIPIDETDLYLPSNSPALEVVKYPLLRQDSVDTNQTDKLTPTTENNDTNIGEEFSTQIVDLNSTQFETSTMNKLMPDTAIILLDYSTIPSSTTDVNQTSSDPGTEILQEYNTTMMGEAINSTAVFAEAQNDTLSIEENTTRSYTEVTDQVIDNTTIISDASQNITEVAEQEIDNSTTLSNTTQNDITATDQAVDVTQNDTSTVVYEDDEYSNETTTLVPTTTAKPVCDQSCQCLRKCHYGFEIINGTCQCDAPCKNYQCFGNDTCSVSKTGQPTCKPNKGFDHDRPFRCYQPIDEGYHDDDVRYYNRWYYNADQDTCHLLVYRGLGGNENNFQTLHECHLECITCAPSPDPGGCLGYLSMWYYDHKKNQCSQFNYSGCKGNENKFIRKQECLDTCIARITNL